MLRRALALVVHDFHLRMIHFQNPSFHDDVQKILDHFLEYFQLILELDDHRIF